MLICMILFCDLQLTIMAIMPSDVSLQNIQKQLVRFKTQLKLAKIRETNANMNKRRISFKKSVPTQLRQNYNTFCQAGDRIACVGRAGGLVLMLRAINGPLPTPRSPGNYFRSLPYECCHLPVGCLLDRTMFNRRPSSQWLPVSSRLLRPTASVLHLRGL